MRNMLNLLSELKIKSSRNTRLDLNCLYVQTNEISNWLVECKICNFINTNCTELRCKACMSNELALGKTSKKHSNNNELKTV